MLTLTRVLLLLGVLLAARVHAAEDVAVAIVYDTSGSMLAPISAPGGKGEPKYEVANRALETIVARLEKYAAEGGKPLKVGVFTFTLQGANAVVSVGPFDPAKIRTWLATFKKPKGGTPLGNATAEAAKALLAVKAGSRHVLVITDGENTVGPKPEVPIGQITQEGMKSGQLVYFHFIAFDVNAAHFAKIKEHGATLLSAADEAQLKDRLSFVLEEKILLEKE